MKNSEYTRLSIDVPRNLHKTLKLVTAQNQTNIKDYVVNLIKEDLSEEIEDYILGQLAIEAEKEGFLGPEESEKFIKRLKKPFDKKSNTHRKKNTKNEKTKRK